jgi:trk system potassium uptake protein TrkH
MLYRAICRTLSIFLLGLSLPLLLPLCIAFYCEHIAPEGLYPQAPATLAFLYTILVALGIGGLLRFIGRKSASALYRKEAFLLVVLVYLLISCVSALPFCFSGTLPRFTDAFFEMVSGYTTTGATVIEGKIYASGKEIPLQKTFTAGNTTTYTYYGTVAPLKNASGQVIATGIEALSPALLIWRSLTQFIGGCGIIILFLALLPILGVGGKVLYQTEATGPSKETMAPRITETASQLWKIYLGLTFLEIFLLKITNLDMPLFDAISISFSTLSTGGFSPKNDSIAAYNSAATDLVVGLFMILGSINFSIYFYLMRGRGYRLKDPELLIFFCVLLFSCLFATWYAGSFRYGAFQVISTITTTGFVTAKFDLWPFPVQSLLLILMFVGGMAGSTAGGMKIVRFQIFFSAILAKIESFFRPDAVRTLRISAGKIIDDKIVSTALCFFIVVVSFVVIGTFLLILDGVDPETSLTTVSSMVNNIGFGFRMARPDLSFAFLSDFGKILCSFWMIAGRLEYFTLLVLLLPSFWRRF